MKSRLYEYVDVLKLNHFLQTLTFAEKIQLTKYRAGSCEDVPLRVLALQSWIDRNNWKPPRI